MGTDLTCVYCGAPRPTRHALRIYCSPRCRRLAWYDRRREEINAQSRREYRDKPHDREKRLAASRRRKASRLGGGKLPIIVTRLTILYSPDDEWPVGHTLPISAVKYDYKYFNGVLFFGNDHQFYRVDTGSLVPTAISGDLSPQVRRLCGLHSKGRKCIVSGETRT